ncbi:hypothetical protein G9A89_021776 [Geosiphon pyriformis]|nr:hypothetical protein G9A89_021776 [Geosiphon pyriformis]
MTSKQEIKNNEPIISSASLVTSTPITKEFNQLRLEDQDTPKNKNQDETQEETSQNFKTPVKIHSQLEQICERVKHQNATVKTLPFDYEETDDDETPLQSPTWNFIHQPEIKHLEQGIQKLKIGENSPTQLSLKGVNNGSFMLDPKINELGEMRKLLSTRAKPASSGGKIFWTVLPVIVLALAIEIGLQFHFDNSLSQQIPLFFSQIFYFHAVDGPIFRKLANTTNSFVDILMDLKVPASANTIEQRTTSQILSSIISRSKSTSAENKDELSKYIQDLGENLYIVGTTTERLFNTGAASLQELDKELITISQNLKLKLILSIENTTYFGQRTDKILVITTKLRDQILKLYKSILEVESVYNGHRYRLNNGFQDVNQFFSHNQERLKKEFDVGLLMSSLEDLRKGLRKIFESKENVNNTLRRLEDLRSLLIHFKEKFGRLVKRKVVSDVDLQILSEASERVKKFMLAWKEKDVEPVQTVIKI